MDASVTELATVEREIAIEAMPETVWELLTDPDRATLWMGQSATFDLRPGGRYRVEVLPGHVASGEFVEVDPPRRLVHTFGWEAGSSVSPGSTTVEYELLPSGEGTLLRLTHRDLPGTEAAAGHAHGWEHYLVRVDPARHDELVAGTGARPMRMRGRELKGWLRVDGDEVANAADLSRWVALGTTYARSLPAKRPEDGARRRAPRRRAAPPADREAARADRRVGDSPRRLSESPPVPANLRRRVSWLSEKRCGRSGRSGSLPASRTSSCRATSSSSPSVS
jgi:uncharacterized protein YndB with AHSA1/START domain